MANKADYERVISKAWEGVPLDLRANVWRKHALAYCRAMWKQNLGVPLPWRHRFGSGNRDTWLSNQVLTINPDQGWYYLNHDFSHLVECIRVGTAHSDRHLEVERAGVELIRKRFLTLGPDPDVHVPKKRTTPVRTWRVIAAELGIEVEVDPFGSGSTWGIFPPKGIIDTERDPYFGDHYTHDVKDARLRVLAYADVLPPVGG